MPDRSRLVALVEDLMFLSRITEAAAGQGLEVTRVRTAPEVLAACRPLPRLVLMDLDSPRLPWVEAIRSVRADPELTAVPIVGFYGHVHAERARQAEEAGITQTYARGAFVQQLGRILDTPPAAS
jgi:CheY-like chemotaxis protein